MANNGELSQRTSSSREDQKQTRIPNRIPSIQIPARLRYGDDAHEDVTAPSRAGPAASQYMNQSIFSMIAAAGSRRDYHQRFDESSDSENDCIGPKDKSPDASRKPRHASHTGRYKDKSLVAPDETAIAEENGPDDTKKKRLSGRNLLQSLPKLSLYKSVRVSSRSPERAPVSDLTSSQSPVDDPRDAPVMSRILTAEAALQASGDDIGSELGRIASKLGRKKTRGRAESTPTTLLATRLMEIFGFDKPETVIAEYPCWLLQSVLLQGYLYVTLQHICFYAYLPKQTNSVAKTGHLSKRGKKSPKYKRFWFTLKGDVLSYYSNPSDLYFPHGNIDLQYGISATLEPEKGKEKECKDFSVTTNQRTYHFRADSAASAKEWVKSLQRTIFRSHNDGDSVKISLPIENVIDIEESPVVEFAETVKVRVIESGDSYAIDEYFFSFFSFGRDALNMLGSLVESASIARASLDVFQQPVEHQTPRNVAATTAGTQGSLDFLSSSPRDTLPKPILRESVRATIGPYMVTDDGKMSPRASGEFTRFARRGSGEFKRSAHSPVRATAEGSGRGYSRASFDRGRINTTDKERSLATSPLAQDHAGGTVISPISNRDEDSSTTPLSPDADPSLSASQILTRSDVFYSRKVHRMATVPSVSSDRQSFGSLVPASSTKPVEEPSSGTADLVEQTSSDHRAALQAEGNESDGPVQKVNRNNSAPAGSSPMARAGTLAGYIKHRSTRMSKLLATESMSYLEKVHGMWAGGHKHYGEHEEVVADDQGVDPEDEEANVGYGDRFRAHFALPPSEKLQATYFGYLLRVLPTYGKIYISNRKLCFRSLLPGTRTKLVLPLKDIENVDKEKGFRFGYHGLVMVIRGHEELFFEFNSTDHRDDCAITLLHSLESVRHMAASDVLAEEEEEDANAAMTENNMLREARRDSVAITDAKTSKVSQSSSLDKDVSPILFDDQHASIINFKPTTSLRITCLTIGSRGDVQPYIALCKALIAEGHKPRIATHAEFGPWVEKHGIEFVSIGGDPAELMRICVEYGMFTYNFLKEAAAKFRTWIDELLSSAWDACQGCDVLIESPSAMAGIHIAEALGIPYFRAFTMPWTRTRAYPHAFAVPEHKIGGAYNYFTYVMFDAVFWKGISGQVNRWRKRQLGLRSTNLDKMHPNKVPFLYNFSPHVVPPPLDYSDWVRVTGYWFLDESEGYTPPEDLVAFIKKARDDKKKLVYIGFGSIVVSDPAALTKTVVESVLKADVRCILSKGWSDRLGGPPNTKTEVPLPPDIFQIKSAPHDWLFLQVDAAVHHGGAGTTGASLRAGIPTVIKPFFGDQFFSGSRVEDLGVGIVLRKINVSLLGRALWEAVHSERMIMKAKLIGEKIRAEDGVATAIQALYRDLEYAHTLTRARQAASKRGHASADAGKDEDHDGHDLDHIFDTHAGLEGDESWTFIGDETDPELRRRIEEFEIHKLGGRGPRVSLSIDREKHHGPARASIDGSATSPHDRKRSMDTRHCLISPKH